MRVTLLEATHYPPDGSPWRTVDTPSPFWPAIEAAIRRLDRDEWPIIWLHTQPPEEGEMPENALGIVGGRGEYSIFLSRDGDEIHFEDPSRSSRVVQVWESDQGSFVPERSLCSDLGLVLGIARYFAENAELDPRVIWRAW